MKQQRFFLLLIAFVAIGLGACKDNNDTDDFTSEYAADLVAGALKKNTNGFAAYLNDVSYWLEEGSGKMLAVQEWECGFSGDSTFVATKEIGGNTFSYNMSYVYSTTCNALNVPTEFVVNLVASGNYEDVRIQSADTTNMGMVFTGLLPPADQYTLNGFFTRDGTQTHKIAGKDLISLITLSVTDVGIDKTSYAITGGTGYITVTVNVDGKVKIYGGNLTFNGNGSVTFVLNGNSYTVDLNG
ncbi:hypothetical protein C7N43_08775 [Sphingobacteriales bacterium UPWRP_1]|nr:hypothetical protein BVG80_10880 [Sphingobacteriales bacterium TSM_CSM]PSJ77423.1 hypothetical protein C7N43_08775 [Sphingobacteriales bacterium UPWRP_1]